MIDTAVLLGYQAKWFIDQSRVRVWEKSRRIGASWICAAESALDASAEDGIDSFYVGFNREMTEEFIRDCSDWAKAFDVVTEDIEEFLFDDESKDILTYRIRFASGHRVTALSSRPTGLRGKQGRIIIDEAAFHDDLGGLLKAAMAILMWGGRVDILSTHNGVMSEFARLVNDVKAGRKDYSLHHTDLDEALADGLYKRICLVNGDKWSPRREAKWRAALIKDYGDDADEELFCVPAKSGGQYLPRPTIEAAMFEAPVFRFESEPGFAQRTDDQRNRMILDWVKPVLGPALEALPKKLLHAFGEDFGRTADLTAIAPLTLKQDLRRVVPFIVELRDVPFREQEIVLKFVVDRLPRFFYGALDATGNGQYLAERAWQKYGEERIECVNLTNRWYAENLPPMKADLEDGKMLVPLDADVLGDLSLIQVINGVPKVPEVRTKQKAASGIKAKTPLRHGDDAIAIALAHYASKQEIGVYEYTSAQKRTTTAPATRSGASGFRRRAGGVL